MTVSELSLRIAAGEAPAILDVRTPREFAAGHIPHAVNIPFNEIGARVRELDVVRDAALVVYCGHGPRAWIAARALRRAGVTVDYLKGHMAAWRRAGLPQER
jgi:rhodanese-related sulfurtransferase